METNPCSQPYIRFLFVRSEICPAGDLLTPAIRLSSDSTSRWTPLPLTNPSHCRADSGLSPYRTCAHRAHTKIRIPTLSSQYADTFHKHHLPRLGDVSLESLFIQLSGSPNYSIPSYDNYTYRLAVSNKTKETNNANPIMWTFLFDPRRFTTSWVYAKNISKSFENFGNFTILRTWHSKNAALSTR